MELQPECGNLLTVRDDLALIRQMPLCRTAASHNVRVGAGSDPGKRTPTSAARFTAALTSGTTEVVFFE